MPHSWDDEKALLFGDDDANIDNHTIDITAPPAHLDVPGHPEAENRSKIPVCVSGERSIKRGKRFMTKKQTQELTNRLAKGLPNSIKGNREITNGMLRFLSVLKYLSRGSRGCVVDGRTVAEIANRAALSRRSVQEFTKKAETLGLIHCERRRKTARFNFPNTYTLLGDLRKKEAFPGGAEKLGVIKTLNLVNNSTSTQDDRIKDVGKRCFAKSRNGENPSQASNTVALREKPQKASRAEENKPRPPAPLPDETGDTLEEQVSLAKRALSEILPGIKAPDTREDIIREVDRLRAKRIPSFSDSAWRVVTSRHGFKAHLAVLETQLMAVIKADTDPIRSLPKYLGGILWKPAGDGPGHPNPASTLRDILATRAEWKEAA